MSLQGAAMLADFLVPEVEEHRLEARALAYWEAAKMAGRLKVWLHPGDVGHCPGDRTLLGEDIFGGESWGSVSFGGSVCRVCRGSASLMGAQWTPRGRRPFWVHT